MDTAERGEGDSEPRLESGVQAVPAPPAARAPEVRDRKRSSGSDGQVRDEAYRKLSLGILVALSTVALGLYGHWLYSARSFSEAGRRASSWIYGLSGADLAGVLLVFGPFIALLAVVISLLVKNGLPDVWQSVRQSTVVGLLLGGCLVAAGLLSTAHLNRLTQLQWHYFVPVVPPVLLAYQALVVWRQRPRNFGRFSLGVSALTAQALRQDGTYERFHATYEQLLRVFGGTRATPPAGPPTIGRTEGAPREAVGPARGRSAAPSVVAGGAYSPAYFVTHFAVPVLLLLLVGFGAMSLAVSPPSVIDTPLILRGLRWGVAGAFVYVLIDFGARFFRNDLTVGAATWAIITLIVGPTLAVLFSVGWRMQVTAADSAWQTGAVLFFAGLAPRRVVAIVETAALKLLKAQADSMGPPKLIPLNQLRGVTMEIAARLREENIEDASALAYADPIRLVQNLPYDLRQVIDWMDQALLAVALPKHYEAVREKGVSGAIDLAWRWLDASVSPESGGKIAVASAPPESFKLLANDADPEARVIYATAGQLFYEEQVCLLWVMYNAFSTAAGMVDSDATREV